MRGIALCVLLIAVLSGLVFAGSLQAQTAFFVGIALLCPVTMMFGGHGSHGGGHHDARAVDPKDRREPRNL